MKNRSEESFEQMKQAFFEGVYHHPLIGKEELQKIMEAHTKIDFNQGDILLEKDKTAREFYLIGNGLLRSFLYDCDGNEITTEFYCVNEILIESFSLFQRMPSKETFQALSDGFAWKIEFDIFQRLLQQLEGLREWGRNWATSQLFVSKLRSVNLLTISATDRYLALINERPQIVQQAPLKYVASYLGITDSSLSRIRKEILTTR